MGILGRAGAGEKGIYFERSRLREVVGLFVCFNFYYVESIAAGVCDRGGRVNTASPFFINYKRCSCHLAQLRCSSGYCRHRVIRARWYWLLKR